MRRSIILAGIALLAVISCTREMEISQETKPNVTFKAFTEGSATKTALEKEGDDYKVNWQSGDQITVVDGAAIPNVGIYSTTSTTTEGSFTFVSGAEAAEPAYKAWYPVALYNAGTPTLPAEQEYAADNIAGAPMYAESGTESLSFKNICGIIRLNVSTTQSGKKVRRILLSADQGMSGTISNAATLAGDGYAAAVSGTAGITLDCGESGVAIGTEPTAFHFAVPANTYTGLAITVETTDGVVQTRALKSGKSIVVGRSSIADVTIPFNVLDATTGSAGIKGGGTQEWVQLWPDGPKWAKFNVGSTITTYAGITERSTASIGGYYSFKGRYDSSPDTGGTSDTATFIWGDGWTTPTKDQLQALIDNCTWEYCDGASVQYESGCTLAGYKVSGKITGYTDNSIFLPQAGIRDQNQSGASSNRGVFWSSSIDDREDYSEYNWSCYLNFDYYGHEVKFHGRQHGLSVRAIYTGE